MFDNFLKKMVAFVICYFIEFSVNADPLNRENIEKALFIHVLQSNLTENFRVQLDHWPSSWNSGKSNEIVIKSFEKVPNTQKFIAEIQHETAVKKITGMIIDQVSIPVLKVTSTGGTEVTKEMIRMENFDQNFIKSNTITSPEFLVGQKVKMQKTVQSNKPVSSDDIERNEIIKKGDVITVHWRDENLTISLPATATKAGAKGDIVPFELSSKKKINARILSANQALSGSSI